MALCKRLNLFPGVRPKMFCWAIRRIGHGFGCTSPARSRREERLNSLTARMRMHHGGGGKLADVCFLDFLVYYVVVSCFVLVGH